MYILAHEMDIFAPKMYTLAPKMDKSLKGTAPVTAFVPFF